MNKMYSSSSSSSMMGKKRPRQHHQHQQPQQSRSRRIRGWEGRSSLPSISLVAIVVGAAATVVFVLSSVYILITIHVLHDSSIADSDIGRISQFYDSFSRWGGSGSGSGSGGSAGDCTRTTATSNIASRRRRNADYGQNNDREIPPQHNKQQDQQQHQHQQQQQYPYDIIHTITTRFMIGQPGETVLARARYLLFETFCFPSMLYQTAQTRQPHTPNNNTNAVFWMVVVDPGLPTEIIEDMRRLLEKIPSQFAYLVLSNRTDWAADGVGVPNSTSYGVHWPTVANEYQKGQLQVLTGNTTNLLSTFRRYTTTATSSISQKPVLVIETLLDGDDGLNNNAIQWIQDAAVRGTLTQQQKLSTKSPHPPTLNSTWWFLTGTDHIEWHNRDIFRISPEEFADNGIQSGVTGWRHAPFFATSAGFTRIGLTTSTVVEEGPIQSSPQTFDGFDVSKMFKFPKDAYSNHALTFYFPECNDQDPHNLTLVHCYRRLFDLKAFVLKTRTITSDSMEHMNSKKPDDYRDVGWVDVDEIPLRLNESEYTWDLLDKQFSISRYGAWTTSVFLYNHRMDILLENKNSRCAPGFPCNKSARKAIVQMQRYWQKQAKGGSKSHEKLSPEEKKERRKKQQERQHKSFEAFLERQNRRKKANIGDGTATAGGNNATTIVKEIGVKKRPRGGTKSFFQRG